MKPLPPFRFSHSQQTKNRVWDGRVENTEFDKRCRIPGGGKNQISGGAPILNFSVLAVGRPFEVGRVPRPVIFMKRKKFGKSLFCLHHILPCLLFGTHVGITYGILLSLRQFATLPLTRRGERRAGAEQTHFPPSHSR